MLGKERPGFRAPEHRAGRPRGWGMSPFEDSKILYRAFHLSHQRTTLLFSKAFRDRLD
jgi:hypothetical protein